MSKVDITLSLLILVGAYSGYRDGFRVELFSVLALFLGVIFGFKLMGMAMVMLEQEFFIDAFALPFISFAAVFFIVLFIVNLIARFIVKRYPEPLLGLADPYAGGLIGLFRTSFMLSLLLWILDSLKFEFPPEWTQNSWLFPMVAHLGPDSIRGVGRVIPFFAGLI